MSSPLVAHVDQRGGVWLLHALEGLFRLPRVPACGFHRASGSSFRQPVDVVFLGGLSVVNHDLPHDYASYGWAPWLRPWSAMEHYALL